MSKVSPAKPRSPKKSETTERKRAAAPAAERSERVVERAERTERTARTSRSRAGDAVAVEADGEGDEQRGSGAMCRSCGKRPGRPTAILGQMTQAELCPQCTQLRKERIRLNRAAARGMRSSRLY
jgi:hypothetical protein